MKKILITVLFALFSSTAFAEDWSWLKNTIWIVPPENLVAYELQGTGIGTMGTRTTTPPTITKLQDQTVYKITGFNQSGTSSYFWGYFYVAVQAGSNKLQSSCGTLLSPITSDGDLIISTTTKQKPLQQNWGTGKMVKKTINGVEQWTMLNWKVGGYVHTAYMIQTVPGDVYYNNLPFLGTSVDSVLSSSKCTNWIPVSPTN